MLHSIVILAAFTRADARCGKMDTTMARWCEDEVVYEGKGHREASAPPPTQWRGPVPVI